MRSKFRQISITDKIIILAVFILLCGSLQSCRTGYGCRVTEQYQAKTDKKGKLSMKRGKTTLFDKKTEKRRTKSRSI